MLKMHGWAKSLARFEMDRQEDEMEKKVAEIELKKILTVINIISVCIIIIGGLVLYFTYRRKKLNLPDGESIEDYMANELKNTKEQQLPSTSFDATE